MAREILPVDEVERIAKEYVRHRENVTDVKVDTAVPSEMGGVLMHVVHGKASRSTVDPTTSPWRVVDEELPFTLWISDESGNVTGYRREPPPLPPPPFPSGEPVEPLPWQPVSPRDYISDSIDRMADANLKRAKAKWYEEKAKSERHKKR
jgi:hypothetical protein